MKLFSYSCGEGFPLIILHGLFGSSDNWQTLSKQFKEHFKVFAIDLRNHGNSPHSEVINHEVMANDLREFMDDQNLPEANLLGHSMGGKVAMQFAGMQPQRLRKLVVADIAPKEYPPHHQDLLEAMLSLDLKEFQSRTEMDTALKGKIPDAGVRRFLLKSVTRDDAGEFRWKINLPAIRTNYARIAAAPEVKNPFTKPTLFLRGDQSNYILPEDEPAIRRLFPDAQFTTINGAGHWLHAEKPREFLATTLTFLRG